jgi:mitochondrial fission protein ELM1
LVFLANLDDLVISLAKLFIVIILIQPQRARSREKAVNLTLSQRQLTRSVEGSDMDVETLSVYDVAEHFRIAILIRFYGGGQFAVCQTEC